jgi:hypothetical protein
MSKARDQIPEGCSGKTLQTLLIMPIIFGLTEVVVGSEDLDHKVLLIEAICSTYAFVLITLSIPRIRNVWIFGGWRASVWFISFLGLKDVFMFLIN